MRTPLHYLLAILAGTALFTLALAPAPASRDKSRPSPYPSSHPLSLTPAPHPSVRSSLPSVVPPRPRSLPLPLTPSLPHPLSPPAPNYCATDPLHHLLLAQDSAYAERTRQLEADYQRAMADARPKTPAPPYLIPVVFHVVHNGGSENITDAAVLKSLDHLNQSFANSDYYDQSTGVDTRIQFCLAERTPDNLPTTGITRTTSALTDLDANGEDLDLKNLIRYAPQDYVNIWIVKEICGLGLGCGVAGYAYLPGAHGGSRDGIVVEAKWLGKSEANSSVLTHEMGHYLGLRHTFQGGCLNDDCTAQGDFVCDTPPDNSTAAVPCSGSVNSCSTDTDSGFATDQDDMFNNYMDYGYWACYNAFTAGQRDRMHFFLDGRRRSLTESPACLPPCPAPVTANFTGGDVTIAVGTSLTFGNASTNADSYQWELDGTPFSTDSDPSYAFNSLGTFRIRLTAASSDPLCFPAFAEQTVTVICPVTSDFTGTFTDIQPGESATYTSTATNATSLSWVVNGTAAGGDPTLDYTFVAPGLYTICLTADNGFCAAERCRNLIVRNATTGCDSTSFVRRYPTGDEVGPTAVLHLPENTDGEYLVSAAPGGLRVARLGPDGQVQQGWRLYGPDQQDLLPVAGLSLADGDLLLAVNRSAPTNLNSPSSAALLRLDPATGNLVWFNELSSSASGTALAAVPGTSAVLWTVVSNTAGTLVAEVHRVETGTGAITAAQSEIWRPTDGVIAFNDLTIGSAGHLLAGYRRGTLSGGAASRPVVAARNPIGTLDWELELASPPGTAVAIDRNGDAWATAINGSDPNATTTPLYLAGGATDGTLGWVRHYLFPTAPDARWRDLIATSDGGWLALLAPIKDNADLPTPPALLLKLAADGTPAWARRFLTIGFTRATPGQYLSETDTGYRLLGQDASDAQPVRYNLDRDGWIAGNCEGIEEATVESFLIEWGGATPGLTAAQPVSPAVPRQAGVVPEPLDSELLCLGDCEPDADCGAPFAFLYQADGPAEGTTLVVRPDGYFFGGRSYDNPLVVATDADGNVQWALNLYPPGSGGTVTDLQWDEAGFLFGVGRYRQQQAGQGYFVFRINPANQTVLWTTPLAISTGGIRNLRVTGISADGLPDQYELSGTLDDFDPAANDLALYWHLDRNTGGIVTAATAYGSGFGDVLHDQSISGGNRYLAGVARIGGAGDIRRRPVVTAVAADGQPLWSKYYLSPATATARQQAMAIAATPAGFILLSSGDDNGTDLTTPDLWLTRHDAAGLLLEGRRLVFPVAVNADQLAGNADYTAILARDAGATPYLLLLDAAGNFRWGRSFPDLQAGNPGRGTSLHLTATGLYLAATRTPGVAVPTIVRLTLDGETVGSCLPGEAFEAQVLPLENPFQSDLDPVANEAEIAPGAPFGAEPSYLELADFSCPLDCPDEEICDDGIDNNGDGLVDCEDPTLALACCCTEAAPLEIGPDTTLCAATALLVAADTGFVSYLWQDGVALRERAITAPGRYSLIATDSCGRMAFDTLTVRLLTPPTLDLGPDTVVCSESVLPLDAGPGFAAYRWIDGSTDPTYTAYGEGTFWVEATDSCGTVHRDTVTVSYDPATVIDLGKIREACPGDTLRLGVPGFTDYTWYPTTGFDCRSCPEVEYVVGSDTMVWVVARNATGCLSTDSLRLVSTPGVGSFTTAELCPGDTLFFGAEAITAPGEYLQAAAIGCGALDTLRVLPLATATGSSDRQICAGDSILIGGRYRNTSGTYVDTLQATNGCDSLHATRLSVRPSPVLTTAYFLCPGDSVMVFGRFERAAGTYEEVYATATGCDSTVRIEVAVSSLDLSVAAIQAACDEVDEGIALATATGGTGPYAFAWSTGATTAGAERLAPGDYGVTVTDRNGCRREATVTIAAAQVQLPTVRTTPESCPGANDATITIDNPPAGYRYDLDGRSGTAFTGLAPGRYALVATSPAGCTDSLSVVVDGGTALFVALPADTTLRLGDSLRITPVHNAGPLVSFAWTPAGAFGCDTCRTVSLRPDQSLTVGLTLRDSAGCRVSDELRIRVDRRELVYVPTAFSPNGDGSNDRWLPYPGPGVRRIALAQIFDRWGNLVYEATDLDPTRSDAGWDGTFGGRPMNPAVFVYRLRVERIDGRTEDRYGEVILLR